MALYEIHNLTRTRSTTDLAKPKAPDHVAYTSRELILNLSDFWHCFTWTLHFYYSVEWANSKSPHICFILSLNIDCIVYRTEEKERKMYRFYPSIPIVSLSIWTIIILIDLNL